MRKFIFGLLMLFSVTAFAQITSSTLEFKGKASTSGHILISDGPVGHVFTELPPTSQPLWIDNSEIETLKFQIELLIIVVGDLIQEVKKLKEPAYPRWSTGGVTTPGIIYYGSHLTAPVSLDSSTLTLPITGKP